jgi:hypothetical protein
VARTESVGRSSGGHVFPPSTLCCALHLTHLFGRKELMGLD